ncbi:MAG: AAA family ATPase [Streptosporangiaceae bacterium]
MTYTASPASEPFAGAAETHSAVVYFAGDRAYKLKKPVNLGFLDFTTVQARASACAREVELNRRFAPDVYLGTAEVRDPGGELCDHLVVMRRMPGQRRMSTLIGAGYDVSLALRQVARTLASQHASAPRSSRIAQQGGQDALLGRWAVNFGEAARLTGHVLDPEDMTEAGHLARRFAGGRGPLLRARMSHGRIVDGHGDLTAGDVFCLEDGPRLLDCLDFDDRLRWLDGLDDAAFLAMDLERLGAPGLARLFMGWYAEYSGDPAPSSLSHHYVAYRAFVRAKVAAIRCGQGDAAAAGEARQLTQITLRHLRAGAVTLVLVGGLPGTGKSALAAEAASKLGWAVLSSDRIRKELAGLPLSGGTPVPYGSGIYAAEWTQRCYDELLRRARLLLASGESVIADASWSRASNRESAVATAAEARADLVQLCCTAVPDLAAERIRRRRDLSDADAEVARRMSADRDPWPAATRIDTDEGGLDAGQPGSGFEHVVRQALAEIRPEGHEHVWRPTRPVMLPG